jgi:hypothetical protein
VRWTRPWNCRPPEYMDRTRRRFRVWRDPFVSHIWRWECALCEPPVYGYRTTRDAWEKIITVSMPHHFRVRHGHHDWVRRAERELVPGG